MAEAKQQTSSHSGRRRNLLIIAYVAAAALGYALGLAGLMPYGPLEASTSTPLARVGLALKTESPQGGAAAWAGLRDDVAAVRASFGAAERAVFDLVAALRGLESGGRADLARAAQSCRAAGFPRCDERALEVLSKRSRP